MNDKYEIAVLADDYETKLMVWQAHSLMNVPLDAEQRRRSAIAYHIAEAELFAARAKLQRAKLRGVR